MPSAHASIALDCSCVSSSPRQSPHDEPSRCGSPAAGLESALMNDRHELISAFLDDEPFDSRLLVEALSEPAGRELLVELVALRHLVRNEGIDAFAASDRHPRRSALRGLVAVAAVLLALVSGYVIGQRRSEAARSVAPPATRIVPATAAWQEIPQGSLP